MICDFQNISESITIKLFTHYNIIRCTLFSYSVEQQKIFYMITTYFLFFIIILNNRRHKRRKEQIMKPRRLHSYPDISDYRDTFKQPNNIRPRSSKRPPPSPRDPNPPPMYFDTNQRDDFKAPKETGRPPDYAPVRHFLLPPFFRWDYITPIHITFSCFISTKVCKFKHIFNSFFTKRNLHVQV